MQFKPLTKEEIFMLRDKEIRQITAELQRVSQLPEPDQHEYPDSAMFQRVAGMDPSLIGETCFTAFFMGLSKKEIRTLTYRLTGVWLKVRLYEAEEYFHAIESACDRAIYQMQSNEQGAI